MSGSNGQKARRLSPDEFGAVLDAAREPLAVVVDADGGVVEDAVQLPVTAPRAVSPASVKLPVRSSARIGEIRSEGAAVAASVASEYVVERWEVERRLAMALAELSLRRGRLVRSRERLGAREKHREELVAGLPRWVRRRLGRRLSRLARATPWAFWVADTLMIANAYGLFGSVALPFPSSSYVSNGVSLVRAAAVSYGLVFGLKLVGSRLRDAAEEMRERAQGVGIACDVLVVMGALGGGVLLALSVAKLQAAFLALTLGGSAIHVPLSVLASIVTFQGTISLATGYFGSEPEVAAVAALDQEIATERDKVEKSEEALALQRGEVRALRRELPAVEEREQFDLAEQAAHTERAVYAHIGGDPLTYGVELNADPAKAPGAS